MSALIFLHVGFIILSASLIHRSVQDDVTAGVWYQGCFTLTHGSNVTRDPTDSFGYTDLKTDPAGKWQDSGKEPLATQCAKYCTALGAKFCLFSCDGGCTCSNNTQGFAKCLDSDCDASYLPCGLESTWALYTSDGPYIRHVTATVDADWLVVGIPVALEVDVEFSRVANITKVSGVHDWPLEVKVSWYFNSGQANTPVPRSVEIDPYSDTQANSPASRPVQEDSYSSDDTTQLLPVEGQTVYGRIQNIFTNWGEQIIGVCAKTRVSKVCFEQTVLVLDPSPRDLQLLPVAVQFDRPSCLPISTTLSDEVQQFAVFKDASFLLESTVATGENLTFNFDILEYGDRYILGTDDSVNNGLKASQEFTFSDAGRFHIRVTVENEYNTVSRNLTVVVVERELSDLNFISKTHGIRAPGQQIIFEVSVTLTSRYNGSLVVDFGDNDTHVSKLEDTNSTSFALECDQGEMTVASSYGNGCVLIIDFKHSFMDEGTYHPQVVVTSYDMTLSTTIAEEIRVMNVLSGAKLRCDKTVLVNKSSDFSLHLASKSQWMEITWRIGDNSDVALLNMTSNKTTLSHIFTAPGTYVVTVVVINDVSRVTATAHVLVQTFIVNVYLSCGPDPVIVTGGNIQCTADILEGSDPTFLWNNQNALSERPLTADLSSSAIYKFQKAGKYNIAVEVYNEVSKQSAVLGHPITVVDPVTCIVIQRLRPTNLGQNAHFNITTCEQTSVKLEFDFGQGRHFYDYKPSSALGVFCSMYNFTTTGVHNVTVYAYNRLSEVSHTTHVLVQRSIPAIKLVILNGEALVNVTTVLYATINGALISRSDLVYAWSFEDGTIINGVPAVSRNFSLVRKYRVNFTASNFVGHYSGHIEIDVRPAFTSPCYVQHPSTVQLWNSITFSPKVSEEWHHVTIDYDNTDKVVSRLPVSHIYSSPGLHKVTINCTGEDLDTATWSSIILVEEPIAGLKLLGPTEIKMEGLLRDYLWRAVAATGTNIVYSWETGNSTLNMFMKNFSKPGVYPVTVKAHNSVSEITATVDVTVRYPNLTASVIIQPTVVDQSSVINITLTGGREFSLMVDFGDGTTINTSSDRLSEDEISLIPSSFNIIPKYIVLLEHKYSIIKTYIVKVNISNSHSYVTKSRVAVVEEPITGIVMTTESPELVSIEDAVVVMVSITSGKKVTFEWDFSDNYNPNTDINRTSHSSVARHVFSIAKKYKVYVRIYSPYYREPITVQLNTTFHVVEKLDKLFIDLMKDKFAAPLIRQSPRQSMYATGPSQATESIEVSAWCQSGTDIQFLFDFGDGYNIQVESFSDYMFNEKGVASHKYVKEGAYNITVTAINPFGSVSASFEELFVVQASAFGLELDKSEYGVKPLDVVTFKAFLNVEGTNVTFDWKLGDQSDIIRDGGSVVNHTYQNVGVYDVMVMAWNKVSNQTDQAKVYVQQELQGVHINVTRDVHATGDQVEFTVTLFPQSAAVKYYEWKFGDTAQTKQSTKGVITHSYRRFGRFIATVKAINLVSHVESPPVMIKVLSKIKNLEIVFKENPIVNLSLTFTAWHYSGSDLTLTWDFGDGTPTVISHDYREAVKHIYTNIGEFFVTLTAENLISREVTTRQLIVMDKICLPPNVKLHNDSLRKIQMHRSESLYIESEVESMECEYTSSVVFRWLIYNQTSSEPIHLNLHKKWNLNQKILYLPPNTFPFGKYLLSLKVLAKGTIVYATRNVTLEVIPTELRASIKGGIFRKVAKTGEVVLDGSNSLDLDNDATGTMSFTWTCSTSFNLNRPKFDCFKSAVPLNASIITIPADLFKDGTKEFLFTLKVSKNKQENEASQVIHLQQKGNLKISIYCPQCDRGIVNSHQFLRLQAICHSCDLKNTDFEWTIETLKGGANEDSNIHGSSCVAADGSSYSSLRINNSVVMTTKDYDTKSIMTTATTTGVTTTTIPPISKDDEFPFIISEGRADSGRQETRRNRNNLLSPIPGTNALEDSLDIAIEENKVSNSRHHESSILSQPETFDIVEGIPGESGSSAGRFPGKYVEVEERKTHNRIDHINEKAIDQDKQCDSPDCIIDPEKIRHNYHILGWDRLPMPLRKSLTDTGFNQQALVIKPGYLLQGRTYIITATVKTKDRSAEGEDMVSFLVNTSPSKGDCEINHQSGIEMTTKFRVYCREWQDENTPLLYEISYSLPGEDDMNIIYQGLQTDVTFTLPAGDLANNFKVHLSIAILDHLGARTSICRLPLSVSPAKKMGEKDLSEEVIHEEMNSGNGSFAELTDKGDTLMLKVLIRYMAVQLNKLSYHGNHTLRNLRISLRRQLLSILFDFPLRNELEVLQTTQALVPITKITNELDRRGLNLAVRLTRKIADNLKTLSEQQVTGNQQLSFLAVRAVSNVIRAVSEYGGAQQRDIWFYNNSLSDSMAALDEIIQTELSFHAMGEKPIRSSEDYVTAVAARYNVQQPPKLTINRTTAYVTGDMRTLLLAANATRTADEFSPTSQCYQVHLTRYQYNPYTFSAEVNDKIHSEVCSVHMYTCDGREVKVRDLKDDNSVYMEIPRLFSETTPSIKHRLERSKMNVHRFNVTRYNINHAFNVHLTFDHVSEGRLFPISVLLGYQDIPTPSSHILNRKFTNTEQINLFIPAGYFNVSGEYYMGVVDSKYNAGRRRENEITLRHYTLRIWWTECLYWNQSKTFWSNYGCQATDKSTYDITHCKCNHLSSFGTYFDSVKYSLQLVPVDEFFAPYENPIAVSLIGTILCIYAVLMFLCHRADVHDARKGGISYLQDNTLSDQQQYEVTVETGYRKGAGTTAKISIILHGEEGMSETRELISDDDRPMFERNSRDKFIMTLPDSIGKIWKVQIWHNNFGSSPSWYLSRVIVKDLTDGNVYYFICEKWLAVEEDDGKVEREFMAVEGDLGFRRVFWAKGNQYMADYHLWTSLFTCPSYSPFRRTQRLTVCLTLLFIYMCFNTIVYHRLHIQYRGEFGLLDLSWRSVTIGVICCTLALPCHLFLAALFRRSKLGQQSDKDFCDEDNRDQQYASGKPNEHSNDEDDDDEDDPVQPIMTYSILDQSILNWPSIQDWAQKQWVKRQNAGIPADENGSVSPDTHSHINPSLYKRVIGSETDQASSGFEDSNSTDPRPQMTISSLASSIKNKAPSVSSSCSPRSTVSETYTKKSEFRVFLPFWFQYVAWFLCCAISLACIIISIWYGFRFGRTKSIMWLQSLYMSVIVCVFIAQPLMVLTATIFTAIKYRKDLSILGHHEDGEKAKAELLRRKRTLGENGNDMEEIERGVAARQRSRYLRFARPPQEKQLIEARKKIMKEKKAISFIRDCVTFCVVFVLVCVIAYGKDDNSTFLLNQAIRDNLYGSGTPSFSSISSPSDWYTWCKSTLVYAIEMTDDPTSQRSVLHGSSFVIGDLLLRQLKERCISSHRLPYLQNQCYHSYSSETKLNKDVGSNTSWSYNSGSRILTSYVRGQHGVYDDSGFVVKLNRSLSEAINQINFLEKNSWIDAQTRAVLVEFTTYNSPSNLFTSTVLFLEIPPSGGVHPEARIASSHIFRYVSKLDSFILACELMFILATIWKLKIEICDVFRKQYHLNGWKVLEMITCVMSLFYVMCYIYRFLVVSQTIENLRSTYYEQFVDVSYIIAWDEVLHASIGFILFLVMIKSLRLLRYSKMFVLIGNVYRKAHKELILLGALLVVLLLAFSSMGHILFGAFNASFRNIWTSIFAASALLTGHLWPESDRVSHTVRIYVFTFSVFVTAFLVTYAVALLMVRLKLSKRKQGKMLVMTVRESVLYYWDTFLLWSGVQEPITFCEPDNTLPPEFTMAEIEYQVEELFFRINALSGCHSLPEKPNEFTDSDEAYGIGDDGISSGGSEVHTGEEERLGYRLQKIEESMCGREPFMAQLLNLDGCGAEMVSLEREKQLRSHLELEIFRQLQNQRQNPAKTSSSSNGQTDSSTDSYTYNNQLVTPYKLLDKGGRSPCEPDARLPLQCGAGVMIRPPSAVTNISDIQPELSSSSNPESPEEHIKNQNRGRKPPDLLINKAKEPTASPSKQLKCVEYKPFRKPELPTKPTFIKPGTSNEIVKPSLLNSPALRQLRNSLGAGDKTVGKGGESNSGSSLTTESSSGSEQDAIHGLQRNIGKRNLRKTKSRGKGKGSVNLSESLFDDLEGDEDDQKMEDIGETNDHVTS